MNPDSLCSVGGPAAPKSEIGGILSELMQNLALARSRMNSLEAAVADVLCPEPECTGIPQALSSASSTLAQHLQHADSEVKALIHHLNQLIDRVQL